MCTSDDFIGKTFGDLIICTRLLNRNKNHCFWCYCKCGNWKAINKGSLTSGDTQSCGCLHKRLVSKLRSKDIIGQTYDYLYVCTRLLNRYKSKAAFWCRCRCGNWSIVTGDSLRSGTIKSCGCLRRELQKINSGKLHKLYHSHVSDEERDRNRNYKRNSKYIALIKSCYQRDNYTCQCCFHKQKEIHAHHILSWNSNLHERYNLNNVITLCPKCHMSYHSKYGDEEECNLTTLNEFLLKEKTLDKVLISANSLMYENINS